MKICELCEKLATIYCESDHANLCWYCDSKVHSANFLVAKHSRTLLCHVCQSPTAWSAAGEKIGRTVSMCEKCVNDEEEEEEEEEEDNVDDDVEEEEEEDIQVVPWSPPPLPESSSSSGESMKSYGNLSLKKRIREDDCDSETSTSHREVGAPSLAEEHCADEFVNSRVRMPSKMQKTEEILSSGLNHQIFDNDRINQQQINFSNR